MSTIRWTYAIARADGGMEVLWSDGPIARDIVEQAVGGPYNILPLRDGTALAVKKDGDLAPNPHYQDGLLGDVVVGKVDGEGKFVGAIGVMVPESK